MGFSEDEKEKLLKIARTTVEQVAKGERNPLTLKSNRRR